jgi:hypothetical protein
MPLDLTFKTSRLFIGYISIFFILALTSISISSALSVSTRIELILVLILLVYCSYKKLLTPRITGLKFSADESWELWLDNQKPVAVKLYGECIVMHYLIWLNFKTLKGNTFHLLLLSDSADKESLRLLRIRLRFLKDN